jgi:segregation and condensation protein A
MNVKVSFHHASEIRVATPLYEGPLDLLLHLIERAELDITKVSLAQVTDQYLDHIKNLVDLAADQVSAFLIIAARLVQIKSEVLLPRGPSIQEKDEDTGEHLVKQLLTYRRFKEIAKLLENRDSAGLRTYLRLAPSTVNSGPTQFIDLLLADLVSAAHSAFERSLLNDKQVPVNSVVPGSRISIRQKLRQIATILHNQSRATFRSMVGDKDSRIEIVVTFLALLELVKRHMVQINQPGLFEEIEIRPSDGWTDEIDFELEFGE